MFKLSKESKLTFYTLILVPCLWIVLNSYGVLDGWKIWTLDQRMTWNPFGLFRGEVSHREASNADDLVRVDENQTVPRVPQVMYVNFDAKTLKDNVKVYHEGNLVFDSGEITGAQSFSIPYSGSAKGFEIVVNEGDSGEVAAAEGAKMEGDS